jgi:hypothetical protein
MSLALAPACDTDDFLVASDSCPASTGEHEDPEGDDCVTGECEEDAVSIDAVAGIQARPASDSASTRPGRPLTLAQERP